MTLSSASSLSYSRVHDIVLDPHTPRQKVLSLLMKSSDIKTYDVSPHSQYSIALVVSSNTPLFSIHYAVLYRMVCELSPEWRSSMKAYIRAKGVHNILDYYRSIDYSKMLQPIDYGVIAYMERATASRIHEYIEQVVPLLVKWQATPAKVTVWNRNVKSSTSNKSLERESIVYQFISIASKYVNISTTSSLTKTKRKKTKEQSTTCTACGGNIDQSSEICEECGKSFAVDTEVRSTSSTEQIKKRLNNIQCKTKFSLDANMTKKLEPYLSKVNTNKNSFKIRYIVYMSNAMSSAGLMNYSENVWKMARDYWPDKVTPLDFTGYEDKIIDMYTEVERIRKIHSIEGSMNRNYLFFRIVELLGIKGVHEKLFPIPEQKAKYDNIWKRVCTKTGWKYLAR